MSNFDVAIASENPGILSSLFYARYVILTLFPCVTTILFLDWSNFETTLNVLMDFKKTINAEIR